MIEIIKNRLAGRTRREKMITAIAGFTTLTYVIYATFFQSQIAEIRFALKTLAALNSTSRNTEKTGGGMNKETGELEKIRREFRELEQKEKMLSGSLTMHGYMDGVLKSMEEAARKMPIQLLELDSKTGIISKQSEYRSASTNRSSLKNSGRNKSAKSAYNAGSVNVSYVKNVIKLKYRSQYPSGVDYFVQLLELPYAVSVLSFEILSSGAKHGVSPDITYSAEIEVYSK